MGETGDRIGSSLMLVRSGRLKQESNDGSETCDLARLRAIYGIPANNADEREQSDEVTSYD